ncbi:LysM peptidoglycan-binding domain-containing protein [Desulfococcus sp.]|uniref:LysM peptidoglycan-binding domain-containing protein n=1 Tax=Desulfococcus sp. TaxID=2025834 RepID=UPI003593E016
MKKKWKIKMTLMLMLLWSFSPVAINAADEKNIVQDETGTYYVVQKGDTLWDISNFFLQSPWYWPEIWSVNSQIPILNPHLIFPGQRLRLFGWKEAPEVLSLPGAPAEPPQIAALRYYHYPLINRIGFIQKDPEKSKGVIFKVRDDKEMISMDDVVYIHESGEKPLVPGDLLSIFRPSVPIYDREKETLLGIQHLITGTVEITEKMDGYTVGIVTQSFRVIRIGDQLMDREERTADIPLTDGTPGLSARIITSEERTYIMGEHDIAFIDKGEQDGVRTGQEYSIFEVERVSPPNGSGKEKASDIVVPIEVGKVLVLLTRPTTATCLITYSERSLQSGLTVDFPGN